MSELDWFKISQSRAWELSEDIINRDWYSDLVGIHMRCVFVDGIEEERLKQEVTDVVKTCFGRRMFNHTRMWSVGFMCGFLPNTFYVVDPEKKRSEWMVYDFDRVVYEREWKISRRSELEQMFESVTRNDFTEDNFNNNPSLKFRFNRIHHLFSQISRTGDVPKFGDINFDHISLDSN